MAGALPGRYKTSVALRDLPAHQTGVALLRRSLEANRVAHAYLLTGPRMAQLELLARAFVKAVLCPQPLRTSDHRRTDACDACSTCRRIEHGTHPDIHWVRPESKLRVITIDQIRDLSREIFLKPHEATHKVGVIVEADCLNPQAANALLKTLEEPPDRSLLLLLATQPERLLETILSRCLRVHFAAAPAAPDQAGVTDWIRALAALAAGDEPGIATRYRMLELVLRRLESARQEAETEVQRALTTGPAEVESEEHRRQAEDSFAGETAAETTATEKAAAEAEYRRRREEVLAAVLAWFRDVWLMTLQVSEARLCYPGLPATEGLARRLTESEARANLFLWEELLRLLRRTNVQELLALEATMLQLRLGEREGTQPRKRSQ